MENLRADVTPIFCIDITSDKNNEKTNGEEFITRTASRNKLDEYEEKHEQLEKTVEKSKLPLWLRIVQYICAAAFIIVLAGVLEADVDVDTAIKNAPVLIAGGVACGIIWLVLFLCAKLKSKKVLGEEKAEEQTRELVEDFKDIHSELGVPSDALDVDILLFQYKVKKGQISPHVSGLQTTPFINLAVKMYETGSEIHIADIENVYSFDKLDIRGITTVNKRISIPAWNKDEDPRRGRFKPYKMTLGNTGDIFFKPYYILNIDRDGQKYGLYFPCYELEAFERMTGFKAEQ